MNGIGGNLDKNVEGEEVPNARNWWEPGGPLPFYVPLDLLLQISQRRREGEDPEYWRRVRREQREAMRREEAERQAREEALRSGEQGEGRERPGEEENSGDDQMAEVVDGGNQLTGQVEGVILEEDDDKNGDLIEAVGVFDEEKESGDESKVLEAGEGNGIENAVEETVEVTKTVMRGDAGAQDGGLGQEELKGGGSEDSEEDEVDQGKDKMDNHIMPRPHVNRQFVTVGEKKAMDLPSGEQGERPGEEENSKDDQMAEGVDGGDQMARQVEGLILEEDGDRNEDLIEADVRVLDDETAEQQGILETVEVTKKVEGGDAGTEELGGTEEIQVGELVFGQEELEGLLEDGGNEDIEVEREAFEGESEAVDQDKDKVDNQIMPRRHVNRQFVTFGKKKELPILEEDKNESLADHGNQVVVVPELPKKKKRKPMIIPDHVIVLPGNLPMYQCKVCQKSFKTKSNIKYHRLCGQPDTAKPFQCQVCKKGFVSKGHYEYHLLQHKDQRPYKCTFCNKAFIVQDILTQHLRIHTGERPFTCEECHRGFSSKQALRFHSSVHSSPYPCLVCDKRFNHPANLKKHAVVHTSERNFSCHICGKRFARPDCLTNHLKIHTDQRTHECKKCSKSFFNKKDLDRHLLVHTDERPFKCARCQRAFRTIDNMKRHLKTCQNQSKDAAKKMGNEAGQANSAGISRSSGINNNDDLLPAADGRNGSASGGANEDVP